MIVLTKVPSKLIQLALDDMIKTEEMGITINMSHWGNGNLNDDLKKCSVCFAGSVMLQTTKKHIKNLDSFDTNGRNEEQYEFLDSIRQGKISSAVSQLNLKHDGYLSKYEAPGYVQLVQDWKGYDEDANVFKEQLRELVTFFESKQL